MRHKLMQVMMERDLEFPLTGWVDLDDTYLGGERSGGKRGRGAPGKTPFVAAVETNEEGHPLRMKLSVVDRFRTTEITPGRNSTSAQALGWSLMGWPTSMASPRRAVLTRRPWSAVDGRACSAPNFPG